MDVRESAIIGSLLGTAVGDALGLPYEGLSRRRGARLFGQPDRHHLLPGRGMISDDTEHACMVAQSLIASGDDENAFARQLAGRLRWWIASLPAGTGRATLKATLKLWLGFPPDRSGVFSAGSGPAMRSPVLGAAIEDMGVLRRLVRVSSRLTHTDPKAEYGAMAVALASRMASSGGLVQPAEFMEMLKHMLAEEPAEELIGLAEQALAMLDESTPTAAATLGFERGVSGYIYHTVPICLHAWLRHQRDYPAAVMGVIRCGGDTDSTAAIVGGIIGSAVGRSGIPGEWLDSLCEWPGTVAWMEELGSRLATARQTSTPGRPPRLPLYGILLRNFFFLVVVMAHGFRRLLPPY